ncbi:GntR family transcriptional regulator [Subtercola boreus]|uniref:GntR family transcriptional regulator n=1 Tax=Subtercola boreus TaxID=120213 RepID=A0A3E0W948_9MICO|nr:GntR family transcriptional regulator [Subtercola boreus]RFA20029.1 GntR family transcriptional regulator [Subtercola boreus]RFA20158.1 GntR family transcriptional regulator [Subtercola boreus]RFA26485.1 GntR family transcriptional regulator [Subtercola boreus]
MATGSSIRVKAARNVLADHVYNQLMVAFMDGRLEADEPLNIDLLSREFEVSQTPIREALVRLESTGLVVRTVLKGYRVAPLFSLGEVVELMDARLLIEPENAFRACSRSTDTLVTQLGETISELDATKHHVESEAIGQYWQADERFHRLIAEAAGNRFLLAAYRSLGGHVQRFRLFGGLGVSDADAAIQEHTRVLEAFRANDPAEARARMDSHICGVRTRAIADASHGHPSA